MGGASCLVPLKDAGVVEHVAKHHADLLVQDVDGVVRRKLVGAAGNARPGTVAPGTYTLFPSFSGGYRVKGPTVTVAEGQTLSFECKSATRVCNAL